MWSRNSRWVGAAPSKTIVEATCMWAPARSIWRNEASSPVSRSSLTARCSHTGGQALNHRPIGLPEPFARSVAKTHSVTALTEAPVRGPYRAPLKSNQPTAESLRERGGSGGPTGRAGNQRAHGGESDGDPSVAVARHRACDREPVS